jgi:transcriptional/translational regulatory protein YebC/TACO1
MFDQKGVVRLEGSVEEEKLLEASVEGEAESYEYSDDAENPGVEVFTETSHLETLNQVLQDYHFPVSEAELRWIPSNTVEVTDSDQARSLLKLIDMLESLDDVQNVTANFDMSDELIDSYQ